MAAYLIANVEIHDMDAIMSYAEQAFPIVSKYGGRYIVRGGQPHVLEGGDMGLKFLAIVEFPNREALEACYHSAEYRPLRELRQRAASSEFVMVDGWGHPEAAATPRRNDA